MSPTPKPLPTDRTIHMQAAMAALLESGSSRKAAASLKAQGIDVGYRSIAIWAKSVDGQAILEKLRSTVGAAFAERILDTARLAHDRLRTALETEKIPPQQLAIILGILIDKAKILTPKQTESDAGVFEVSVRFGGIPAQPQGTTIGPTLASEMVGGEVVVKRSGS